MYYYSYSPSPSAPPQHQHQRRHIPKRLFVVFVVAVVGTLVAFHLFPHPVKADTHPQLAKELGSIIAANPSVSIGVALIDLDDNDTSFTYGQTTPFIAASTTKILTAAAFLHGVEQGSYSLTMPLGISTASWQLQEMVNQSDNDSWSLFLGLIGNTPLTAYARRIGLTSFDVDSNTISPLDEARLLAKLYQHQLLNATDTSLLLSYMQNTNDETFIPPRCRPARSYITNTASCSIPTMMARAILCTTPPSFHIKTGILYWLSIPINQTTWTSLRANRSFTKSPTT